MPAALNDTFTVGIILIFLLGAVFFYFYTRLGQVEKRMKLLETILLDLKVATENSFVGFPAPTKEPEPMETTDEENDLLAEYVPKMPISHAKPVVEDQFEEIDAEEEGDIPMMATTSAVAAEGDRRVVELSGVAAEEHVAATEVHEEIEIHKITDNYDFQTMKELHALAKQKGLTGTSGLKRAALIEALRQKDAEAVAVAAPEPTAAEPEAAAEEVTAETIDEVFGQELAE
jgi:hypothetical protein